MKMLAPNLKVALQTAIRAQREIEAKEGFTRDSALVGGWQEILDAVSVGKQVIIESVED